MKFKSTHRRILAISVSSLLTISSAHAVTYYWDCNDTTSGFGTAGGTWSGTTTGTATYGWSTDSTGVTVVNANSVTTSNADATTDAVNFGTAALGLSAGTITVSGTVASGNITFGAASAAITLSGGTITLAPASTITVNNSTDTISSILGGAGTSMTKAGSGTLILSGANTYTGTTTISGGTLTVGNGSSGSLGTTPSTFLGALTFNNSGTFNVAEATGSNQKMGVLTFTAGDGNVTSTAAGGSGNLATLTFDSLVARASGATGNFTLAANTTVGENKILLSSTPNAPLTTSGSNDRGLFFGGTEYARYDAINGFRATAYGAVADSNAPAPVSGTTIGATTIATDIKLNGAITGQTATTVNTINLGGANNITFDNAGVILSVNGILASAGATLINGTTVSSIRPGTAGGELVIRVDGASNTLGIQPKIVDFTSASALTKSGAGTLNIVNLNTYTGATTINGGTLQIGGGGNLNAGTYAGAIAIRQGATFTWASTAAQTLSGNITGTGSVTLNNTSAVLTLSGASNTYSGGFTLTAGQVGSIQGTTYNGFGTGLLTLNGGRLQGINTTATTIIPNDILWNAGTVQFGRSGGGNPTWALNGNVTLGGSVVTTQINSTEIVQLIFNGNISDGGNGYSFTFTSGVNSVTFNGQNTFSGNITQSAGSVTIGGSGYLNGGNYAGVITTSGAFNYSSTATQTLSGGSANAISGLTTVTAGTLELAKTSGNAIVNGGLTIGGANNTAATVRYTGGSSDMMGTGTVTINGRGVLDFNGKNDTIGSVVINSTGATGSSPTPIINTAGGGNLTIGSTGTVLTITPTAGLTTVVNSGSGTLTLGGNVTFTAATSGQAQISGNLALGASARTFDVGLGTGSNQDLLVDALVSGSGGITKSGLGRLTLSGSNSYTGATILNAGTLRLDYSTNNNSKLSNTAATGTLTLNGGTLELYGGSHAETVLSTTLNTGGTFIKQTGGGSTLDMGAITFTGGAIDFSAPSIATTTSTVTNGILSQRATVAGANFAMKSGSNIVAYDYVGANGSTGYTGGTMAANMNYSLTASGASTLAGPTGATTNTLQIANTATGSLDVGTNTLTVGAILFAGSASYDITTSGSGTIVPTLLHNYGTGASTVLNLGALGGDLTQFGTGKTVLNNAATTDSTLNINGGTVQFSNNLQIGTNATVKAIALNNGTLLADTSGGNIALNNGGLNSRTVTLGAGGGTLDVIGANKLTVSGAISGSTPLTIGSASTIGTIELTAANTNSGGTTINGGTLSLGHATNTLADAGAVNINNGGTLSIGANSDTVGTITIAQGGSITGTTGILTTSSFISNNGGTMTGATLVLANNAGFAYNSTGPGSTTLQIDKLTINDSGTNVFDIADGAAAVDFDITGALNNSGNNVSRTLTKTGAGAMQFSGNTLGTAGQNGIFLNINQGTVLMNRATGVAFAPGSALLITVGDGIGSAGSAILKFAATGGNEQLGNRPITINSDGLFDLNGKTQTTSGALTMNGGSITTGIGTLSLGNATNTISGASTVTGNLTFTGTVATNLTLGNTADINGTTTFSSTGGITATGTPTIRGTLALGTNSHTISVTNASDTLAISALITGSTGTITKSGSGKLTLTNSNTYSGFTTVSGGTLSVTGGGQLYSNLNAAKANAIIINTGGTIEFDNWQYGTSGGSFGTLFYDAANFVINGGTLRYVGTTSAANRSFTIGANGATLESATGGQKWTQTSASGFTTFVSSSGGTLTLTGVGDGQIDQIIPGSGGLTKSGNGKWTLGGTNTYTGKTTVQAGTLSYSDSNASATADQQLGKNTALDLGITSNSTGATLQYSGSGVGTLAKNINALGRGLNAIQNSGNGLLTLTGTLTKNGTTLTLKGGAQGITISGTGTIAGTNGVLHNSDLVIDGGTTTLATANTYDGPTSIINGGTLNANVTNALPTTNGRTAVFIDQDVSGTNTGSGSSTLALGASQSIASLSGQGTTGTSLVNLNANTLTIGTTSGSTTFAGNINGTNGSITKDGASTQVLSGSNGYTGSTTVAASGGTLEVRGSLSGTTAVTVNTGGTLLLNSNSGSSIVNTAAAVNLSGGTLAFGNAANQVQNLSTLSLSVNSTLDFGSGTSGNDTFRFTALGSHTAGVLTISNWNGNLSGSANDGDADRLVFNASLTAINSFFGPSDISFTGYGSGWAAIDLGGGTSFEIVPVPEPATTALIGAVGLCALIGYRERRRFCRTHKNGS